MTITADAETLVRVCAVSDLEVERGRAALFGSTQIALFLLADGSVHAVSNRDPYTGAQVMSRGIVGTRDGAPTVASPLHKQVFDLRTGLCVDTRGGEPASLRVWKLVERGGELLFDVAETA
ncbi:nitrite reductase small subunit NirD [Microbacterium sp. MAHUQ-60]|uniref:nitrite reductase small subunit NirD n=1 Tax=unclassified Microbacterium TaxID=2609290 RepID=UPI0036227225